MMIRLGFAAILLGLLCAAVQPSLASAQGTDTLLDNEVCRTDPYSEDCICAAVKQVALFPREINPVGDGTALSSDPDGIVPFLNSDGIWKDGVGEDVDYWALATDAARAANPNLRSELVYVQTNEYGQQCALSYFRENQRRLWVFTVSVGGLFSVISMIIIAITYMQHSASGVDLSKARLMLIRVCIGVIILACSMLAWESVNAFLFSNLQSWTFDRGTFYDFR